LRFSVDTNLLVYSYEDDDPVRQRISGEILHRGIDAGLVLTAQALAEFLNVVRRKRPAALTMAVGIVGNWSRLYPVQATDHGVVLAAGEMSARHQLQLWDCIIWQAARRAGASYLLTEDLQDGFALDGMAALNPFVEANSGILAELLQPL
jgi:predicted nucleic acid-binding protein